jgi:3-deoxy-manno-octulosonate cytidylyltransferase (CMP-KDO synthetase)
VSIAIIPARMGSSRFPGKPLAPIQGIPMIGHCYFRTAMSRRLDATYIATCDDEIASYAKKIGAPFIMTSSTHERATDRIAEAMETIERQTGKRQDIVVMVQGDEPMVRPEMLDLAIEALEATADVDVVNLMAPIDDLDDFEDPNEVKVVISPDDYALYFSREPIPSRRKGVLDGPRLKQVCIIPFRRDYLLAYNATPQTPLEKIESVDMMRVIETGRRIKMAMSPFTTYAVDTPEDLAFVDGLMTGDELLPKYRDKGRA